MRAYTAHYRDPHVFERDGQWWMVIGAQKDGKKKKHRTGAVVVYTSVDRRSWDFKGELDFTDPTVEGCYMYECPSLLQLRDEATGTLRDVLIFSPQGLSPEGRSTRISTSQGTLSASLTRKPCGLRCTPRSRSWMPGSSSTPRRLCTVPAPARMMMPRTRRL